MTGVARADPPGHASLSLATGGVSYILQTNLGIPTTSPGFAPYDSTPSRHMEVA